MLVYFSRFLLDREAFSLCRTNHKAHTVFRPPAPQGHGVWLYQTPCCNLSLSQVLVVLRIHCVVTKQSMLVDLYIQYTNIMIIYQYIYTFYAYLQTYVELLHQHQ